MRHCTTTLTAKHYLDPAMLDTAGAVERLPGIHANGGHEAQPQARAERGVTPTPKKGRQYGYQIPPQRGKTWHFLARK